MTDRIDGWIQDHLGENREVPRDAVQKAKDLMPGRRQAAACPHCGKPITGLKKPLSAQRWSNALWLGAAVGAFVLSFVFPKYFVQCLVVALICACKWIVEHRATKTQILIYKALSQEAGTEQHRLHKHGSPL
jgi:hypothetical protein